MSANPNQPRTEDRLLAFKVWLDNGKPPFRVLSAMLEERGCKVAHGTLVKWAQKNPEWTRAMLEKEPAKPEKILIALAAAKADATKLEADHFVGVKAQLVGRLYESVKQLPLNNIADWNQALDCCDRLEALIHAERGKAVVQPGNNVSTSLMERLAPAVSIPAFKKPAANGGG